MSGRESPHFTPIDLRPIFNARREALTGGLRAVDPKDYGHGRQVFRGIPFEMGGADEQNVVVLEAGAAAVDLELGGLAATYLIFLHAVEDRPPAQEGELANAAPTGNELGECVAEYELEYA